MSRKRRRVLMLEDDREMVELLTQDVRVVCGGGSAKVLDLGELDSLAAGPES